MPRTIKETKATCTVCGHVWYYGKQDTRENTSANLLKIGKGLMCCTGCLPALLIPNKTAVDLSKCPQCKSRAVKEERVEHEI